jgi:hypothetical protein
MSDPGGEVVSFHGHRAVFSSSSPYLDRVLREPKNYYGASVFFDACGAARHAHSVLRYMYLGAGCLSMEEDALRAYRVVFGRLEMAEELRAVETLLESYGSEAAEEEEAEAAPPAKPKAETRAPQRRRGPSIQLSVFVRGSMARRSARLKKPRRSRRVRQLSIGS